MCQLACFPFVASEILQHPAAPRIKENVCHALGVYTRIVPCKSCCRMKRQRHHGLSHRDKIQKFSHRTELRQRMPPFKDPPTHEKSTRAGRPPLGQLSLSCWTETMSKLSRGQTGGGPNGLDPRSILCIPHGPPPQGAVPWPCSQRTLVYNQSLHGRCWTSRLRSLTLNATGRSLTTSLPPDWRSAVSASRRRRPRPGHSPAGPHPAGPEWPGIRRHRCP